MKFILTGVGLLMVSSAAVSAGGIERAPQSLSALFEAGNYAELSFGGVDPSVQGTDAADFGTGDVAQGYGFAGLSYKHQFNENLSAALIIEQPFGADIRYRNAADGGSVVLGGTRAIVDSTTYTALLRYRFANNFSVHGGLRGSHADGEVTLAGLAYGPLAGYSTKLDSDWGVGYVVGGAYEMPEIAARVSLTYNSKIEHGFDTLESLTGQSLGAKSTTTVDTPESLTFEAQSGIAERTLLFGSIRWVNWSEFLVEPTVLKQLSGDGLVSLEDTTTYTIGVGRKFTEVWSGSASMSYEPKGDDLVSPLAPTNGRLGMTLAAIYTMDQFKVTTGINYTKLGNASAATGGQERARIDDNDAWGIGMRIGYSF